MQTTKNNYLMNYFLSIITGYLLGSIPTAYLVLKRMKGIDITKEGSGNVGARNSYDVTKSKLLSASVLFIDMLKGFASVLIVQQLIGIEYLYSVLALIGAVFAHCYSPWLKFKGGRGLATAFGGSVLFVYSIPIIWILFWSVAYLFRKHIHFSNIAATILTGAIAISSSDILNKYTKQSAEEDWIFGVTVAIVMVIIMSRHIEPFKEWFFSQNRKSIRDENETI
ncbi:MAG: glycerol-3-phosphate acyltransferase [Melioribacteraceae bacterium]|nr:glycerol-3-phosphate acyltransferase [Melioribacteraceae bacterium]